MGFERLTIVGDGAQAALIRALLDAEGIQSFDRQTDFAAAGLFGPYGGPHEVLVHSEDLERARELLSAAPLDADDV